MSHSVLIAALLGICTVLAACGGTLAAPVATPPEAVTAQPTPRTSAPRPGAAIAQPARSAQTEAAIRKATTTMGGMGQGRIFHTATLLQDGRVLVVGGGPGPDAAALESTEIYDPGSGAWTQAGDLVEARGGHTATRLSDGRVLVVGGRPGGDSPAVASAEMFDPSDGTWLPAAGPEQPRSLHTATLLQDGRVLVAGGEISDEGGILESAEIFDPSTDSWVSAGKMAQARAFQSATLLEDGRVLVAGGSSAPGLGFLASVELYDPSAGTWSTTTSMQIARGGHAAALLSEGRLLVAGGRTGRGWPLPRAEVYDVLTSSWTPVSSMRRPRYSHTATVLEDGRVLVVGLGLGFRQQGLSENVRRFLASAEVYDPATDSWSSTSPMLQSRELHTATLLSDGSVLVAGGRRSEFEILASAEVYVPASDGWLSEDEDALPAQTSSEVEQPGTAPAPAPDAPVGPASPEGLWVGDIVETTVPGHPLWLALRLIPGDDPDADRWRVERGPYPSVLPPAISCSPTPKDGGWELGNCVGLQGQRFAAFVPEQSGLKVKVAYSQRGLAFTSTLSLVPQRDEPQSSANVTLLWSQPGEGMHSDIWAQDGLVFAPHVSDGSIEVRDAGTGALLGTATVPEAGRGQRNAVWDVKAANGVLYAATAVHGLVVFDVSEPSSPEMIGQYRVFIEDERNSPENFVDIHNIFLSPDGKLVFAINTSAFPASDLRIIDVSDPTSPREVGRFVKEDAAFLEGVHDVNVIERDGRLIAFLNYLEAGLWVLDVTDPSAVIVLGSIKWDGIFSHSGWAFPLDGRLYYAHAEEGDDKHLTVLDVTDLADPQVVASFRTRDGISIHNVQVVEGVAYISYYVDGLRVVDLRNPEAPLELGHYDTVPADDERDILQGVWGVRVMDGAVYLSDIETGTYAVRVEVD